VKLQHIVVAVDQSGAGRGAFRTALDLARRAPARVTAFRAISCSRVTARALVGSAEPPDAALDELTQWLAETGAEASKARIDLAYGSPGH
jgi:nucleotide-binding universal stress UspA family protein